MEKIVLISDSDDEKARDIDAPSQWYTVVHEVVNSRELATRNPWSHDESIYEKQCYLMDDCVISFRPARYEDRIGRIQDYNKGLYFIEIANQDSTQIFTSNKVYEWDKVVSLSGLFTGVSFTAATRVWKAKKL